MSEENRIRFAGLMEDYLNIPAFVCEFIEKQLKDKKYKEVVEYVVQRRNEIENKEDYLSEQEKINQYLGLQQKVEQLESIRKEIKEYIEKNVVCFKNGDMLVELNVDDLSNILNKGDNNEKNE